MVEYRDRIKELRRVRAGDLIANPANWRKHPQEQVDALRRVLDNVGWADALLARETPEGLETLDGHLRAGLDEDAVVPVLVLDLTDDEAAQVLATHDPIAQMAETDYDALAALVANLDTDYSDILQSLLEDAQPWDWETTAAAADNIGDYEPEAGDEGSDQDDEPPDDGLVRVVLLIPRDDEVKVREAVERALKKWPAVEIA